ncbi:MAG: alpha-amylase [Proteobacteria bacterium]|nr:alpha-amylase [Pseudomonadota bacterium]
MGVMMQGFFWDCHKEENRIENWWNHIRENVPLLKKTGITGLWLPPAHKGDQRLGMGYDPYDFFDLGEFDQRGGIPTGFGTRQQLVDLIRCCHENGIQVYADVVYNHCSGGSLEDNPDTASEYYTHFMPASGKFQRDYTYFNPSRYESYDGHDRFGGFPDLCHRNPDVYRSLLEHGAFLVEHIGFDGFRFDLVKGYGSWIITALLEYRYKPEDGRKNQNDNNWEYWRPFGFGESWSGDREIREWMHSCNSWSDNPVSALDFPLRYRLKELCDTPGFSLHELIKPGALFIDQPFNAVTFVDNHDFRDDVNPPVISEKMLAYAFILTHPGYPCIFWKDYFIYQLALPGEPSGIDALISIHERFAGGNTITRFISDDLYIMERSGWDDQPGLIFVLNTREDGWHGRWVDTTRKNTCFKPVAWRGRSNMDTPIESISAQDGRAQFWAPPRGYAVYAPMP